MGEIRCSLERQNVANIYEALEEIDIGDAWLVLDKKESKKFEKWMETVKNTLYDSMHQYDLKQINHYQNH
jgi:hypothetical protein